MDSLIIIINFLMEALQLFGALVAINTALKLNLILRSAKALTGTVKIVMDSVYKQQKEEQEGRNGIH